MTSPFYDTFNRAFPHRYASSHYIRSGKDIYLKSELDLLSEEIVNAPRENGRVKHEYRHWIPAAEGRIELQVDTDKYNTHLRAIDTGCADARKENLDRVIAENKTFADQAYKAPSAFLFDIEIRPPITGSKSCSMWRYSAPVTDIGSGVFHVKDSAKLSLIHI